MFDHIKGANSEKLMSAARTQAIGKKLVSAIRKSAAGKYALYVSQAISLVILARLFSPEDFGLYAAASVICLFFLVLAEAGLTPALIQHPPNTQKSAVTLLLLTASLGLILYLSFYLLIPVTSGITADERTRDLLPIAGAAILFSALSTAPIAELTRSVKFIKIAYIEVAAELLSLAIAIICWHNSLGATSLAWKFLSFHAIRCIASIIVAHLEKDYVERTDEDQSSSSFAKIVKFAKSQIQFNILNYLSRNLDNLLVARYFSSMELGVYDKAYQLMRYPLLLITNAITPAIQPSLSALRSEPESLRFVHHKLFRALGGVGLAVGLVVFLGADWIVKIILGEQWTAVGELLKILSATIPLQVVMSSSGGFFQAAGRPDLMLSSGRFSAACNSAFIIAGVLCGELAFICWAILASFSINFCQCYYLLVRDVLNDTIGSFVRSMRLLLLGQIALTTLVLVALGHSYV